MGRRFAIGAAGFFTLLTLSGCSAGYVLRAAYEQSKIIVGRRQINLVMLDPDTTAEEREKLQLVLDAREYAESMGLDPGGSFKSYVHVKRDPLAWVVVASRREAFQLRTWWFPIVGSVPYKGFFDKEDAESEIQRLAVDGYEASMRGTEAFSTLGWFDDPVVSTTLKNPPTRIANTVIHESVHSTIWIPGNVAFNESLANFVGSEGAISFFRSRLEKCAGQCDERAVLERQREAAHKEQDFQLELATQIEALYSALESLYQDPKISSDEKIRRREEIFARVMAPFRRRYPSLTILKEVNNADIIQLKLYLTNLSLFRDLFRARGGEWVPFIQAIRQVQSRVEKDPTTDPFVALKEVIGVPA